MVGIDLPLGNGLDDLFRDKTPPTPEQIAVRAAAVRSEWTDKEQIKRLRVDWRAGCL